MAGEGAISIQNALFIVLGCNIGTCVTAILASIGTTVNAKRTAFVHLAFNVIGSAMFAVFLWIFATPFVNVLQSLIPGIQMQIAWFHVVFNVTTTLALVGFAKPLAKLSQLVIQDKPSRENACQLRFVDDLLLKTPSVAIMQVKQEIKYMSALARENVTASLQAIAGTSIDGAKMQENESIINFTNRALTKYLIDLSPLVSRRDERQVGAYFHVLNDLERIGDHAKNFYEIATQMAEENLSFSPTAQAGLKNMGETVLQMFDIATSAFEMGQTNGLDELARLETQTDAYKRDLTRQHFIRLTNGNCDMQTGAYFFSTVSGLERVADHLVNVGYSIVNPTGSQV
jgi:phosphate:Na+ symporter